IIAAIPALASAQTARAQAPLTYALTDLGTIEGGTFSAVGSLNGAGTVTGQVEVITPEFSLEFHAFIYSRGTMVDIGRLPDEEIAAGVSINSRGQIAGYGAGGPCSRAFLYTNGAMLDLGTFGGVCAAAFGINDRGDVTGFAQSGNGSQHAFLYRN